MATAWLQPSYSSGYSMGIGWVQDGYSSPYSMGYSMEYSTPRIIDLSGFLGSLAPRVVRFLLKYIMLISYLHVI